MAVIRSFRGLVHRLHLVCAASSALAITAPASGKDEPIGFELIEARVDQSGIQVFNGSTALRGNWSAILVARMPAASGLQSCTATLVGQRVLLTAAHCVDQGTVRARDATIRVGSTTLVSSCQMSDAYANGFPFAGALRAEEDFALCSIDPATTSLPAKFLSLRRETIDLTPLVSGIPVLITGYGCTGMDVDLDRGTISQRPFEPGIFSAGDETVDTVTGTRISTFSQQAREPALCEGDSGGPLMTGASVDDPDGERRIRGVNSEITVEQTGLRSQFASLSSEAFRGFIACWRKKHPSAPLNLAGEAGVTPCDAQ